MKLSEIMSDQIRASCQSYHDIISAVTESAIKQGIIVSVEIFRKPTDNKIYQSITARPCRSVYTQLSDQVKLEEKDNEPG